MFPGALFRVTPAELAKRTQRYGFATGAECDDPDAAVIPGAEEQTDGISGAPDPDETEAWPAPNAADDLANAAD